MKNTRINFSGKVFGFILGVAVLIYFLLFPVDAGRPETGYMLGVALLMASWWIFEVVPLAVTALIPVALMPLLGISDGKTVSTAYFNEVIFLFLGGFIMALAMQRWGLHRRIALRILMFTGTHPAGVLFGFMAATAFLSMWISNTATAMMMIPILLSVISSFEERGAGRKMAVGLLLGVAYSASIGGIATLVGTPPNLSFVRIFHIMFPAAPEVSFGQWMLFALPLSVVMLLLIWLLLWRMFMGGASGMTIQRSMLADQYKTLGRMTREEKLVLVHFVAMALLWTFRSELETGWFTLPGWSGLLPHAAFINDGTVAVALGVSLFLFPSKAKGVRLMDWETAKGLPWDIVLLFGGGFALASGIRDSGLAMWFGEQLQWLGVLHPFVFMTLVVSMMTFVTELTSNTATTEMVLPVLAGLAVSTDIHPLLLMIPATVAASMAFMMPVATPPNAIIFGTGRLSVMEMAKAGLIINLIGIVVLSMFAWFWGAVVFGLENNSFPVGW